MAMMMVALGTSLTPGEIKEYVWLHAGHLETSTTTTERAVEAEVEATTTAAETAEGAERVVGTTTTTTERAVEAEVEATTTAAETAEEAGRVVGTTTTTTTTTTERAVGAEVEATTTAAEMAEEAGRVVETATTTTTTATVRAVGAEAEEKAERAVGVAEAAASRNHRDLLVLALALAAVGGVGFMLCALSASWCLARLERALRGGVEGTYRRGDWQCRNERRERETGHQLTL